MDQLILRLGAFDRRLLLALITRRRPFLTRFMRHYTHLGDAPVAIGVAGGLAVGVVPGWEMWGLHGVVALVLCHLLSQFLKRTISRPRPHLPVGFSFLVAAPDRFSFPSGHSSASMAIAMALAMGTGVGMVGMVALILAALIGLSRCYLGVHYPGDVAAGWALAFLSVMTTAGVPTLLRGIFLPG